MKPSLMLSLFIFTIIVSLLERTPTRGKKGTAAESTGAWCLVTTSFKESYSCSFKQVIAFRKHSMHLLINCLSVFEQINMPRNADPR